MKIYSDIYEFIKTQEQSMLQPIFVNDNYSWSFKEHVKLTILYKNFQLENGKNKGQIDEKPVKNITLPILRLQYRTEGFDVKDIELFVNDAKNYYKSFLVKKYHTKWARENEIDTFIDEMVESYVDFGGALIKKTSNAVPEVVPISSIAFCDQTNLLSGPIGIKHYFAPHELKEMESVGWGSETNGATISIDNLILLAEAEREPEQNQQGGQKNQTPGGYIEIYEIHGSLPEQFISDTAERKYALQTQIVGFYNNEKGQRQGVTLFAKKISELPLKLILRDKIHGRALGVGGAEELFENQIWTNLDALRMKEMLDAASKIIFKTTDDNFANRNNLNDLDNGEIVTLAKGEDIAQLDTTPRNLTAFKSNVEEWQFHAQQMAAAQDPIQGEAPKSGVPFRAQALSINQAQGIHEYRKGKLATFLDQIYREWIIPHIVREISQGTEFLAELEVDELQEIADKITENQSNRFIIEKILNGEIVLPEEIQLFKEKTKQEFLRGGNKRFIKILKNELKNAPIDVYTNIIGKQAYLSQQVDKLSGIIQQLLNPQVLQAMSMNPGLAKTFNEILEKSGLSPIQFASLIKLGEQPMRSEILPPQGSLEMMPTA